MPRVLHFSAVYYNGTAYMCYRVSLMLTSHPCHCSIAGELGFASAWQRPKPIIMVNHGSCLHPAYTNYERGIVRQLGNGNVFQWVMVIVES